jgi:FkbH-like protein
LAAAGYFEAVAFSNEDRERANYYQANAQRAHALAASGDLDGYLASLNMVCTISRWDDISRTRVAQLINKSNQFNLTTRRYSEREVEVIVRDQGRHAIQIRLVDKFGDNGIISVILAIKTPDEWTIDTWLMSCRVLGRRVQDVALSHLVAAAKAEGAKYLIGHYIPTGKNRMVESHYENLGFHKVERDVAGTWWRLDVGACSLPSELPMTIHDNAIHRVSCGPGE